MRAHPFHERTRIVGADGHERSGGGSTVCASLGRSGCPMRSPSMCLRWPGSAAGASARSSLAPARTIATQSQARGREGDVRLAAFFGRSTAGVLVSIASAEGSIVPGGSDYRGPADALKRYAAVVEETGEVVKGAKNPYTSRNGHMFSFLDVEGTMAIRLSNELAEEFLSTYESGPVIQYGSVMRGYVSVPDDLLSDTEEVGFWLSKSHEWIGTLEPKATKR